MQVTGSSIGDKQDDFVLAHAAATTTPSTVTAFVSAPGSHVDEVALGCLMARASTAPDAAFFAICRRASGAPADVRIIWRSRAGAASAQVDLPIDANLTPAFLSLQTQQPESGRTCVSGKASKDGLTWTDPQVECFEDNLPLVGLAADSHSTTPVMFLFGNVTVGAQPSQSSVAFPVVDSIGNGKLVAPLFAGPVVPPIGGCAP